jgi:hypothetical protein
MLPLEMYEYWRKRMGTRMTDKVISNYYTGHEKVDKPNSYNRTPHHGGFVT